MLEPGALGKPILTGPHLFNFAEISELFVSAEALIKVTDANTLAETLLRIIKNTGERIKMGERALKVVAANRGALARQLELVSNIIQPKDDCSSSWKTRYW
jgi:3-deoxy-D-manno-octulosonic-acid transferase